jgi:ribosomal-protein-alanine N-acetyltransferase
MLDLERILEIERASFGADAWERELFLNYLSRHPDLFLVARRARRIAGYSITCAGSKEAELGSIAVDPRDRRQGVARALLDETLVQLRSRRIKTLRLMVATSNEPAALFYEKYGFQRTRRVKRYYGAGRDAWSMRMAV